MNFFTSQFIHGRTIDTLPKADNSHLNIDDPFLLERRQVLLQLVSGRVLFSHGPHQEFLGPLVGPCGSGENSITPNK